MLLDIDIDIDIYSLKFLLIIIKFVMLNTNNMSSLNSLDSNDQSRIDLEIKPKIDA